MLTTFQDKIIRCKNPKQCLGDLLFIHGFCVDYHYFTAAEELSKYLNIYMLNLPGHGNNTKNITHDDLTFDSMTDYVIKYVEHKRLKDFYLMGHSMGGAIVSMIENKIPNRIKKLILCCPINFGALFSGFKSFYIFYPKNMKQKYRLLDCLYKDYKSHMSKPG
ncbi:hypothetical protein FACS1894166_06550 [Bacilli bacterium]|nr:hypothetical protein FACS1894166_06550 [Bacilli bacterium]